MARPFTNPEKGRKLQYAITLYQEDIDRLDKYKERGFSSKSEFIREIIGYYFEVKKDGTQSLEQKTG